MGNDIWIVVRWWGTLFLVGAVAFPLTRRIFAGWHDEGYLFAKAVGMAVITYFVYILGFTHLLAFTQRSLLVALVLLFAGGIALIHWGEKVDRGNKGDRHLIILRIFFEELFFFIALMFWSWVKGHEPSIHGLEKFMDYGFMKSILESAFFPAPDMWYAGYPINYYYFGHTVVAVLTKLSGIDLSYTFNLMLATIFALTLTMSYSIGLQLLRLRGRIGVIGQIGGGLFTAFLVTLAGNMQTIYAFTKGYTGDDVKPFWQLLWSAGEFWSKLPEGLNRYWYANATRFIPFTIHEFPSYSFVVSDVHGHVLSLPFTLLAIGLLIAMSIQGSVVRIKETMSLYIFYGFLVAILLMTNALDGPIYFALFLLLTLLLHTKTLLFSFAWWKEKAIAIALVGGVALITSLPFLSHFKSFVTGVAVNCPPAFLENSKMGPLLFEGVEKCQHSPIWMMTLLWGFFLFSGLGFWLRKIGGIRRLRHIGHIWRRECTQTEKLLGIFFVLSLVLIIFPEFFYFKDIYPAHFRSNTMFKLGYQAFILFSLVSAYTIMHFFSELYHTVKGRMGIIVFFFLLVPQLFLVSMYPIFSVRSYFNGLRAYQGLYGLTWLERQYPDDWAAITWLNQQGRSATMSGNPVIVEADGDSYTDYERFSAFTGMPTIVGWAVHEWLWRGGYDVVAPRREEVRRIYESDDSRLTQDILRKYHVTYIVVGRLEKEKYPVSKVKNFTVFGSRVFSSGETAIYAVSSARP